MKKIFSPLKGKRIMNKLKEHLKNEFLKNLNQYINNLNTYISTDNGEWIVKGFIDIAQRIYTISIDTKVISKILELLIFPKLLEFAAFNYTIELSEAQNFYPDITFTDKLENRYALDIKSTYRESENKVNGMTLGSFTGYFRNRESTKNIKYPYNSYVGHFVLGIIYSRNEEHLDEQKIYTLDEILRIPSVIKDFQLFVNEKWRIASDKPGSGNTKNIGSVKEIDKLLNGEGPFVEYGEEIFDDYWMYYLTNDMARSISLAQPSYSNLEEYFRYKNIGVKKSGEN
ncbi:type II restriction endonuclease [Fervidobacterium sp.]